MLNKEFRNNAHFVFINILSKLEKYTRLNIKINDTTYVHTVFFQIVCIKIEGCKHYKLQSEEWNLTQQFGGARVTTTIMIEIHGR